IIWHVTLETSSGLWVTVLTLAAFLPQMVMSLFAGVWADRYDRKRIIIISDTVIAVTTLALALFMKSGKTGEAVLPAIIIVSVIRSLGSGVQTPTVNAMLPQIVPEDNLSRVNGYNGTIQSIVQFVSPVAAGAIMAIGPIYNILFIDVATAIIGIGILFLLKIPKHQLIEKTKSMSVFSEMKEGFKFTWNHKFLKRMLAIYGAYIFLCVPSGFLTALMIERTFGDNVMFMAINETVGFAGALVGGLLLGVTGGFKNRNKTFFLGAMLYGIVTFAVGFTNIFWLFAGLMFFVGMTIPAVQTAVFTMVQEKTNPSMMGRVFSLVNVMFTGFMPLGMAIFGPLADVVRIQTMVIVCAVFIMILALSIILSKDFYSEGVTAPSVEVEEGIGADYASK
ncbi:MAG: MFS transporter, partial [Candidatus Izemoplasmatales bacterium]|nr:MFS transporter [Candidatus Izemoplasmatales bacterium]